MKTEFTPFKRTNLWYANPEACVERITTKQWQDILLTAEDEYVARGRMYVIKGKCIAPGIYEIHAETKYKD